MRFDEISGDLHDNQDSNNDRGFDDAVGNEEDDDDDDDDKIDDGQVLLVWWYLDRRRRVDESIDSTDVGNDLDILIDMMRYFLKSW